MSKIVFRTLDFFEAFASQKKPLLLTDLVKLLDIPLSSCHDVVQALQERGYIYEVRPRGGYYPTARLFHMAKLIVENDPVVQRAEPSLQALSDELYASVSLGKGRDESLIYLIVCDSPDPLRFSVKVGASARNLYATSAGKCYLGSFTEDRRKEIVDGLTLTPLTRNTITSKKKLLENVAESEARGWYENREESVDDALTISTHFEWSGSTYVITIAGTKTRMEKQLQHAIKSMRALAQKLEQQS